MTRLAAVLARAYHGMVEAREDEHCDHDPHHDLGLSVDPECVMTADDLVAAIPEPERSALEAALDVCGREGCGLIRGHPWHIADHEVGKHSPLPRCHPFVTSEVAP